MGVAPLILFLAMVTAGWAEEENSVQRLENSQKGMAEGSWPKKPDNRLSPLSGKMKEISEISPRYYGENQEYRAPTLDLLQKEAALGQRPAWGGAQASRWEGARWAKGEERTALGEKNDVFQPGEDSPTYRTLTFREVEKQASPDWSSRSSRTVALADGSLHKYEGRLTRVRAEVKNAEENGRDLGAGRQEKFRPDEVEKMLADPVGRFREPVREQSREASPRAAADN